MLFIALNGPELWFESIALPSIASSSYGYLWNTKGLVASLRWEHFVFRKDVFELRASYFCTHFSWQPVRAHIWQPL